MIAKKITITLPEEVAKAARLKSDETGVPVSTAIQRLLSEWVTTGVLPMPQALPAEPKPRKARKAAPKA